MNRRGSAPTRKDVAAIAGVAPSTVSLVLNGTESARVSDATRKRIHAAVAQLGYRPSSIARSLVSGRTQTIGVVMHWVDAPFNGYTSRILDGVWRHLQQAGYRFLMVSGDKTNALGGLYRERCVDGLLVLATPLQADDPELREALAADVPLVFTGARPGIGGGEYVDIDNRGVAREATTRLIAAGCRRICHLTGPTDVNSSAVDRHAGYRDALEAAGLPYDEALVRYGSYSSIVAPRELEAVLETEGAIDGIFSANIGMAGACRELLVERGLRVPQDVKLIAIDSSAVGGREDTISTYGQPLRELGELAATRLLSLIEDPKQARGDRHIACRFIDCGTV